MKFYSFVNCYLSDIQKGIQTAHVVAEVSQLAHDNVESWARINKTIIVLNGENNLNMNNILTIFKAHANDFAWSWFYEDKDSMSGMLTAIGIVLPSWAVYDVSRIRSNVPEAHSSENTSHKLILEIIAGHKLA